MYKILFVDEVDADIRTFQRYVHKQDTNKEFELVTKKPISDLDELIEGIFAEGVDAVISDYQLAEYQSDISYTGVELIEKIFKKKHDFPCFVMTSHDDDAVATSSDVNIVYIKGLMNKEENVNITFLERVKTQIDHYRVRVTTFTKEFNGLLDKGKAGSLTASEETRLVELDYILEKSLSNESKIPPQLKEQTTLTKLHKLIDNTDLLFKKWDGKNGD